MTRFTTIGLSLVALALGAMPAIAMAADFPPSPPTTYYGSASGATNGQAVIAFVSDGTNSTACGRGAVVNDATAGLVYVIDVASDSQVAGCGKSGRNVTFYFPPAGGQGGRVSANSAPWQDAGPRPFSITLGTALAPRNVAAQAAKDGVY